MEWQSNGVYKWSESSSEAKPGSYIALTRQWKNGDCVEVTYPMQVHIETTPDNPNKGALLYGPVVLAGERGTENMKTPASFLILHCIMIIILTIIRFLQT